MLSRRVYLAPQLSVVECRAERGYAGSRQLLNTLVLLYSSDDGDSGLESRTNGGYWGGGDGDTWK